MAKIKDKKIAIISGGGRLPFLVRDELLAQGYDAFIIGIKNFADRILKPDLWVRLGAIGTVIRETKKREIKRIAFVGSLGHPNLGDIIPDMAAIKILARVAKNQNGYDSMLRTLAGEIEKLGFEIVAAQKLCPALTFSIGPQTNTRPTAADKKDIARGTEISKTIGKLDIGASVVVHKQVLAMEAAEGTAKMLARVKEFNKKRGGVMVKLIKPGQDLRMDITAVGLETIKQCKAARLSGIVVSARNCWAIDKEDMIRFANRNKMFIIAK